MTVGIVSHDKEIDKEIKFCMVYSALLIVIVSSLFLNTIYSFADDLSCNVISKIIRFIIKHKIKIF
jgi:hypothetical protein